MNIRIGSLCAFTLISLLSLFAFAGQAGAQNYIFGSLYDFCAGPQDTPCTDGILPETALVQDSSGNLYGTTTYGSTNVNLYCGFLAPGCGTVFELNSAGQETLLYSFCSAPNCTDGTFPNSALILDAAGNLYGTTSNGGSSSVGNCMGSHFQTGGCGTVFRVDIKGREKVLYNFCSASNCTDGAGPNGLIRDAAGKLYGTTTGGGAYGGGTVFTLDHLNNVSHLTVLYSFCSEPNCADGSGPGGLLRDTAGNLYGTTYGGGANNKGTVFKLDRSGHETVLYSFCSASNCTDGSGANPGLDQDAAGNLYGTTSYGGAVNSNGFSGGTVFELEPPAQARGDWTENVLYSFCSKGGYYCTDGEFPNGGLIRDGQGKLYGTTGEGGDPLAGGGTVFKLGPRDGGGWNEYVLYTFCVGDPSCQDGQYPSAGLIQDAAGNLYGTTATGGNLYGNVSCFNLPLCGTVFEVTSGNTVVTLTSTPNPAQVDQPVTFSVVALGAVDSATPSGSVTFEEGTTPVGTVTLIDGQASFTTTFTQSREFSIKAIYSGDENYKATKSKPLKQLVEK